MPERDREKREHAAEEPATRTAAAPPLPRILQLQRSAGNRAVSALLQRQAPPAAPPDARAVAEANALESIVQLRDTHREMLASPVQRIRNTALMIDPPGERPAGRRVRTTPMTLRSDSAQLVADHGGDPATTGYYFYGPHQDNEHEDGLNTLGTVEGDSTIVIRVKNPSTGALQSRSDLVDTFVHETSHIIVSDYGEHPGTDTDSGSFDRYKDEFRAYFIEPNGPFSALAADARAAAIRVHMCGATKGTGDYEDLDAAFWAEPLATNQFRARVLAHRAPDGFNLDNSPYLDRLVHLLRDQQAGRATVEETLFQITVLSPTERTEAAAATLISTLLARLPAAEAARIRSALTSPAAVNYGRELNPSASPRITAFLEAITTRAPDPIKDAYRLCDPNDRGELTANAHFLSWLGRVLPSEIVMRTCITCMVQGRSFVYFERVRVFLSACTDATGAAEMPEPLRAALRALSFEVRLAYIGLCRDDYDTRVQPLQEPVRNEVRAILRGDREP
jgi:hypothetical protein